MKQVTKFLFFPKTICNHTKWLVIATYTKNRNAATGNWKDVWWN